MLANYAVFSGDRTTAAARAAVAKDKKAKWKAAALASDAADGDDDATTAAEKASRKLDKVLSENKLARRATNISNALAKLRCSDVLLLLGASLECFS